MRTHHGAARWLQTATTHCDYEWSEEETGATQATTRVKAFISIKSIDQKRISYSPENWRRSIASGGKVEKTHRVQRFVRLRMSFFLYDELIGLYLSGVKEPKVFTLTHHKEKAITFSCIQAAQDYVEANDLPPEFKVKHDSETV